MIQLIIFIIACGVISAVTGISALLIAITLPVAILLFCFVWAIINESGIHKLR